MTFSQTQSQSYNTYWKGFNRSFTMPVANWAMKFISQIHRLRDTKTETDTGITEHPFIQWDLSQYKTQQGFIWCFWHTTKNKCLNLESDITLLISRNVFSENVLLLKKVNVL